MARALIRHSDGYVKPHHLAKLAPDSGNFRRAKHRHGPIKTSRPCGMKQRAKFKNMIRMAMGDENIGQAVNG
jgi:hypothetical protein